MLGKKIISKLILISCFFFISCATNSIMEFDRKMTDKGYTEANSSSFPSKMIQDILSQKIDGPYEFELINTDSANYAVIYKYFFEECSDEMINKYVKVIIIDKYGFYKIYENENINNEKGKAYEFKGSVYDKYGRRIENPVFYLWD